MTKRRDLMEELMARSSDSEFEDDGSGEEDDEDDSVDDEETESEPEKPRAKREPAPAPSDDSDDSDESDESDDSETEDETPTSRQAQLRRELSTADLERAARYEAEESAIVVKEERGARGLFGDDDDDDDYDDYDDYDGLGERAARGVKEALDSATDDDAEDEEAEEVSKAMDAKLLAESFTESLLASGDERLAQQGENEEADEAAVRAHEAKLQPVSEAERYETKTALWSLVAHVSRREQSALRHGQRLDGPPIEDPIAHSDEFKRKFRWPVRMMNLPEQDFAQDPIEIYNDYELELARTEQQDQQAAPGSYQAHARRASAFAPVPRPIVEAAAAAAAESQRASRKRKRPCGTVSATALTVAARVGEQFTDRLLASLISDNASALQGSNPGYSQRSWTPLPVSRRPVANWRFVLENALKQSVGDAAGGRLSASLRPETLHRIRERLKTLNSLPWKSDDSDLFTSPSHPDASTDSHAAELVIL
ncbi:hypothetical protein PybrP1_000326 [[Pythium] brassicae (nom. inval.)]|nr:hypothetical protein PybrP1_000326 [[Pythium] brassicae (nom. inval.)]